MRYAQLALTQGTAETAGSFYIDIVRRAARSGLAVAHQGQGRMFATKFGAVEAAPLTLSAKTEQACQAFRFTDESAAFTFQGWLCGSSAPDDAQLACFIDGIGLAGSSRPVPEGDLRPGRAQPHRSLRTGGPHRLGRRQDSGPTVTRTRCMTLQP